MHKQILNEAIINLTISAAGPLLIKGQSDSGVDPTRPDVQFVRTGGVIYLPGSSLKGLLRSHCERIIRTMKGNVWSCNPFGTRSLSRDKEEDQYSCDVYFRSKGDLVGSSAQKYTNSCTACRIFGNSVLAGRAQIADAQPSSEVITEERHSIAIDRIYGSPISSTQLNYEVVTIGSFETTLRLKNYTLAQLGLIALALRDISQQRLFLGSGRSRGLGQIEADIKEVTIRYPLCSLNGSIELLNGRKVGETNQLLGIGALTDKKDYSFSKEDVAPLSEKHSYSADIWSGVELKSTEETEILELWQGCVNRWREEVTNGA